MFINRIYNKLHGSTIHKSVSMSRYKFIGEFAGNYITGVAGTFKMHEKNGTLYLDKVVSTPNKQILTITHTDEHTECVWEVTFNRKSSKHKEVK